ncbi:MAG: hydantoinase/oxoprolinase family protein [Anaerolineae bacterium]
MDVGGTFTDLVMLTPGGLEMRKLASTPRHPERAVLAGVLDLDAAAHAAVRHGTTVATNALLEGRGARTAFAVTEGFRDLLALGRGTRPGLYDLEPQAPDRLVPRNLCFEVPGRLAADGTVVRPLTAGEAADVAARVAAAGADSAAVCLLFSFLDPAHEEVVGRALAEVPGGPGHVSLSARVLPVFREYERAATVVANAYVGPLLEEYLTRLALGTEPRQLRVMASHGGTIEASAAALRGAATVLSGPAAGVQGAMAVARSCGEDHAISLDMGGTSTDVALCPGEVPFRASTQVGPWPVYLPGVAVETVGAGGGSIITADNAGALRVGPASAGADPGPAAYDRGGQVPTLTDAHVILGRLPADWPLASGLRLSRARARDAISGVASALGLTVEEAAAGAVRVANAVMERAMRRVSVAEGYDPANFTLVAFGGAGPLHVCELAAALGISRVLVPVLPGALSALGLALAPPRAVASRSVRGLAGRSMGWSGIEGTFKALGNVARGRASARGGGGGAAPPEALEMTYLADARYVGQSWELTVEWPPEGDVVSATPGPAATWRWSQ